MTTECTYFLFPALARTQNHCRNEQQAYHHLAGESTHTQENEAIEQKSQKQRPNRSLCHAALTTVKRRASHHGGRQRLEFKLKSSEAVRGREPCQVKERGDAHADTAESSSK